MAVVPVPVVGERSPSPLAPEDDQTSSVPGKTKVKFCQDQKSQQMPRKGFRGLSASENATDAAELVCLS